MHFLSSDIPKLMRLVKYLIPVAITCIITNNENQKQPFHLTIEMSFAVILTNGILCFRIYKYNTDMLNNEIIWTKNYTPKYCRMINWTKD